MQPPEDRAFDHHRGKKAAVMSNWAASVYYARLQVKIDLSVCTA
jgi:hypothetical protein